MSLQGTHIPVRGVRRRVVRGVTLGVVVTLVLVLIGTAGAEVYLRNRIEHCVATGLRDDLGSSVSVGLGSRPVLLGLLDRQLPVLTVDSDDARFGSAQGMAVHAQLYEVSMPEDGAAAEAARSQARVDWSSEAIERTLAGLADDVTTSPADGTVDVTLAAGIVAVRLRPYVDNGAIRIETVSARGVPPHLAAEIVDLLTRSLGDYPLGLRPQSVTVTGSGIRVELAGGRTQLPASTANC